MSVAAPTPLPVLADGIPTALRALPRWMGWRYQFVADRWTKEPVVIRTGHRGDVTDPASHCDFQEAFDAYTQPGTPLHGVAFCLMPEDGLVGMDFDHVGAMNGEIFEVDNDILVMIEGIGSYAERSPGGDGVRVIAFGTLPPTGRKKGNIEMYDSKRMLTITGHGIGAYPEPVTRTKAIHELHQQIFGQASEQSDYSHAATPPVDDATVLERVSAQITFKILWEGRWAGRYPSQSEADLALCRLLAAWSRDPAQIDRLFRQSRLYREKWDRDDYRARTIEAALKGTRPHGDPVASSPSLSESLATFLSEADRPHEVIFPELLPVGVILLFHGDARARKSLAAFELAISAATGTAPFGLARFLPKGAVPVWYIQEEDPRGLTRTRLRRLIRVRCGTQIPEMTVSVRRGINLDDPAYVTEIIETCRAKGIRLLVLDAARRLSAKTDEGPAKVRELTAVLRRIVDEAGVTLIIVHHDVKPPRDGQDQRRRGQRASGGDWFAACECPVHVERLDESRSQCFPQDYKFSADPAPFEFTCHASGLPRLIDSLVGKDITTEDAETAGLDGKVFDWLRVNGPASKTAMKAAGLGWDRLGPVLERLTMRGLVDTKPGMRRNSTLFFVIEGSVSDSQDGTRPGRKDQRGESST